MSQLLDPLEQRDFSAGRVAKSAVATALMPNYSTHSLTSAVNSVADSVNVDFSEIIGSGIVRKGKTNVATLVAATIKSQSQSTTNSYSEVYGINWYAQTFTAQANQTVFVGATLNVSKFGTIVDNVTLSLRATSGGVPTGADLYSVSVPASSLTIPSSFNFTPFVNLVAGTVYALVFRYTPGDATDYIKWFKNSAGGYAGGQAVSSGDSGVTWAAMTGQDFEFAVYTQDSTTVLNTNPFGFLDFSLSGIAHGVVVYANTLDTTGTLFYYDTATTHWETSQLSLLSLTATPYRFAVANGYVFISNANGVMLSSANGGNTWGTTNCITLSSDSSVSPTLVTPNLLLVAQDYMLASGYITYPSRVYFSSVINSDNPTGLTWNTTPATGDWIDVDPDDGGVITAMAVNSTTILIFKNNAMYRLSAPNRSVDADNIFNIGAVSQEAVVNCMGLTYFYSGSGIWSTDSTFPVQISRIGVQDFVDAITPSGTGLSSQVFAGTDGFNVYFSIGNVTLNYGPEDQRTYTNVVLKFSPRDQNWQVFSFPERQGFYSTFNLYPLIPQFQTAQYDGHIEQLNYTTNNSDNGRAIDFYMDTQELEFQNRSHEKNISDKIIVYAENGNESSFSVKSNDGNFKSAIMTLENRLNVGTNNINFAGNYFTFKWHGESNGSRPIFQGFNLPKVTDLGVTKNG